MAATHKEITEEIERLASFIDRQVVNTRQLYHRLAPYLDDYRKNISKITDTCKPVLKKQGLQIHILFLKAQLRLLDEMIESRKPAMTREGQNAGKKKGGL